MSSEGDRPDGGAVENLSGITFAWEKHPRGMTQVQAHYGDRLFHCSSFKLDNAKERARFGREVVGRAREQFGVEADPDDLEAALLGFIEARAANGDQEPAAAPVEYHVVEDQDDPDRNGIYAVGPSGPVQLTNCVIVIDRDVKVVDESLSSRSFEGRAILHGVVTDFKISSEEFGLGVKLLSAIYKAAGPKVQVYCKTEVLARAVSAISAPERRVTTTAFGWSAEGDEYRSPSVRVDAAGVHAVGERDPIRVDLQDEQCARHLDLAVAGRSELAELKTHVVEDLLLLHDRRVTYLTLAAVALAVLFPFTRGMNRPAVWLIGLTGGGKSFVAKLFQNFFGDFPVELGSAVGSWSSTANFLQNEGSYFKDALFLVDDYKPEVARHADVVKLLQNYADGSARGRLNRDATTNVSRPIRGILLATGEAVPEHTPSAMARSVIVAVPTGVKDVERGKRCLARRPRYPALTAGFIRHLLRRDRPRQFVARVQKLQQQYYGPIAGEQNDLRIAGNLALLGAAFEEFARYLGKSWPGRKINAQKFVDRDLAAIRDEMVRAVREQQPSEIFLATLQSLVEHGRVQMGGWPAIQGVEPAAKHQPMIGRVVPRQGGSPPMLEISTSLALEAVQESLRKQGRPPLAVTERSLLDQLAADGKLLDPDGRPIGPGANGKGSRTRDANLGGSTRKVFRIAAGELVEPRARSPRPVEGSTGALDD